ncbi:hypothetical protein KJ627_00300, partial [Patescibacteria group bacterium]|nr:hypothetical protein [Patescibacteria group bacterium]
TKKYGGAKPQKQSRYGGMLRGKKRAGKNFPSPDPFLFCPPALGVRGLCPRLSLLNFLFKFLFSFALVWAIKSLIYKLNSAERA